jgi:hypothetical protein
MTTKAEIINNAYSWVRISGITKNPTASETKKALDRLESMAEEFKGRNICVNYNFEDVPDTDSVHNIHRKYWTAFETNLAARLLADFGKNATPELIAAQQASFSFLSADTAQVKQTQYPPRQPIGSGNTLRRYRYRNYYVPAAEAPTSCATNKMIIDDVDDFVEHFDAYLAESEVISSYTIEADTGLTILSDSNTDEDVNYRVRADGNTGEESDTVFQVKIVVTTDDSRVTTRLINFELTEVEL